MLRHHLFCLKHPVGGLLGLGLASFFELGGESPAVEHVDNAHFLGLDWTVLMLFSKKIGNTVFKFDFIDVHQVCICLILIIDHRVVVI